MALKKKDRAFVGSGVICTNIRQVVDALNFVSAVDVLTTGPANTVEFLPENEEGTGADNNCVVIFNEAFGWEERRFYGVTVLQALEAAVAALP